MPVHNPLRTPQKPAGQQEEITAELSSVVDNTMRYARLFWSALLFFAVVFGIIYADRYVSAYEKDLVERREILTRMMEGIESKNIAFVPVPDSLYKKMTEGGE
jgi:hypothetical protein